MLSRLVGLETEYGLHIQQLSDDMGASQTRTVSSADLFFKVLEGLASLMPTAMACSGSRRFFLANGASISLESNPNGDPRRGLIESATPECCSPREVITHQTALDEMLAEAIVDAWPGKSVHLIKNSSDSIGHIYGQQENYEVEIASGWRLAVWRIGLVLLLPGIVLYKLGSSLWLGSLFLVAGLFHLVQSFVRRWIRGKRWHTAASRMDSTVSTSDGTSKTADRTTLRGAFARFEHSEFLSPRWMRLGASGLRCLHWPIAAGLHLLVQATAIVPLRRYLSPFLSSRIIIDGCGHLDTGGKYWLGAKATSITHLIGFGRYWGERPIFVVGHWLEGICSDRLFSLRHWRKLFARRQRIQISLGDSTPSDHVEYLRIGMTCLVLDLIEQRPIHALPQLRDPVAALERFAGDPMLMQTVPDRAQHRWTAVELHRVYARAVRDMLLSRDNPPEEAWRILHAWQSTLDHLEDGKSEAESQRWLLGRVDWLSKKWLMEQLGTPTSWNAKKKVDIRYHELSPHGYCRRFWRALQIEPLVEPAEVARARRVPPAGTPAAKRGYYIREFAECDEFRVDWDSVEFRDGGKRQSISLG